jgi:phage shock protein C
MSASRTKFYLDKQNGKWSGVCAGIADYSGIDVLWVRVGAVLITLMGGFPWTLIAYWLVAWMGTAKPFALYGSNEEAKFWQGVRSNPSASARRRDRQPALSALPTRAERQQGEDT